MTEDYRGSARTTLGRDPPSANDKNPERHFSGPPNSAQICKTPGQESSGRYFYITGIRNNTRPRGSQGHQVLETYFQKLSEKAISPHQATPGSVDYDLFTPLDFVIQPREQKTVFTDLAVMPPEGYYAQLMLKSGLTVLYELEVKAGVIEPDYTGNIRVVLKNNSDKPVERVVFKQIAQLLFIKVATPMLVQVSSLTKTQHGEYGFGAHSTH